MKKLILLSLCLFSCDSEQEPQIGERRIYNRMLYIEPNNPFIEGDTVEVRDVKNSYVQFVIWNYYNTPISKSGYIDNESLEGFNNHTRKIE